MAHIHVIVASAPGDGRSTLANEIKAHCESLNLGVSLIDSERPEVQNEQHYERLEGIKNRNTEVTIETFVTDKRNFDLGKLRHLTRMESRITELEGFIRMIAHSTDVSEVDPELNGAALRLLDE